MTVRIAAGACLLVWLIFCTPGRASASNGPARTETLAAGPYVVDVNLYQDPPITDQWVRVSVVPHDSALRLSGYLFIAPGIATDAVPTISALSPVGDSNTLAGTMHMPVRGAWEVWVMLDGSQGQGKAMLTITVAAPGAMPVWLAWIIGLSPVLVIAWLIWHQTRYRRLLLREAFTEYSSR